jgi:hypothetical protein
VFPLIRRLFGIPFALALIKSPYKQKFIAFFYASGPDINISLQNRFSNTVPTFCEKQQTTNVCAFEHSSKMHSNKQNSGGRETAIQGLGGRCALFIKQRGLSVKNHLRT